ncbi:GyrI-like domain-containing protein [Flavobacterium sp.]|uniref:GyrI-like domain-containing protein n=1 Tax=Flavobacterium sp. TaxID=239 RepID=UPI0037500113
MFQNKKLLSAFVILFSVFLIWYLFIKKSDYTINFKAKAATRTIFQGIQDWSKVQSQNTNKKYKIIEKQNFDFIKQELISGTNSYTYSWKMNTINDSITQVSVDINEKNASIYNRLTAPFFNTKFKQEQLKKIEDFRDGLNQHLKTHKVKIDGVGTSEETLVAYINLKSVMQEKAQTMIMNDGKITGFLHNNSIKINGKPYLEVLNWEENKETLEFNYCFPIDKNTKIISDSLVKFKKLPALKGLMATYYGNYRTSDRAWFTLIDYAKNHNYKLSKKPLEHFFANPFNGGNELEWETKIIIPFSK